MNREPDGVTIVSGESSDAQHPTTVVSVLRAALGEVSRDPALVGPFVVVGVLVSLADWLRRWDPIPAGTPGWRADTASLQYSIFPQGVARTDRYVGALVDLELAYFLGAVTLELMVTLAIGVAGWLTIRRTLDADAGVGSLGRYLGVFAALTLPSALVGQVEFTPGSLPLTLLVFVVAALVLVSLFPLPGYLAAGHDIVTALRESITTASGKRTQLFGLVLVFGLGAWGLALVPVAGGFLSTAISAPFQAVTVAVVVRGDVAENRGR